MNAPSSSVLSQSILEEFVLFAQHHHLFARDVSFANKTRIIVLDADFSPDHWGNLLHFSVDHHLEYRARPGTAATSNLFQIAYIDAQPIQNPDWARQVREIRAHRHSLDVALLATPEYVARRPFFKTYFTKSYGITNTFTFQ